MSSINTNAKIKLNNFGLTFSRSFKEVRYVDLELEVIDNRFLFSITGLDPRSIKSLQGTNPIYIQFKRFSEKKSKMVYPVKLGEKENEVDGRINVRQFQTIGFQRMDLTDWVEILLYKISILRPNYRRGIKINQTGVDYKGKVSTGVYYTFIDFKVTLGYTEFYNRSINVTNPEEDDLPPPYSWKYITPTPQDIKDEIHASIRVNFYNNGGPLSGQFSINENGEIDVY